MNAIVDLSVLIPTFKRTELLNECLNSIKKQKVTPKEILIGNDDPTNQIDEVKLRALFELPICVLNRQESLGQSKNVNNLIQNASSSWLMILHDDDLLIQNSLDSFFSNINLDNDYCIYYGMQKILKNEILQNDDEAMSFNKKFKREETTMLPTIFQAVSSHTIPSNCFIINTDIAKKIQYTYFVIFSSYGLIKDACDYAFTWKLYKYGLKPIFVPIFTSIYRITESSVSNSKNVTILESFLIELDILSNCRLTDSEKTIMKKKLKRRFIKSLKICIRDANWYLLKKILFSKFIYKF